MPVQKDINFNAGFTGCNDRMAILRNETVPRRLDVFEEVDPVDIDPEMFVYIDSDGKSQKIRLGNIINAGVVPVQSDWDEEDDTKYSYIRNKPDINDLLYLDEELVSLYNIGGIHSGQKFPAGTSLADILKEMLSVTHPEVFYVGVINSLSPNVESDMNEIEVATDKLISDGYKWEDIHLNNQYWAIALPKDSHVDLTGVFQEGFALGFTRIDLDSAWWLIVDENLVKSTGTYTFDLKFKLK